MATGLPGDPKWDEKIAQDYGNLGRLFRQKADEKPTYTAQRYKENGAWVDFPRRRLAEAAAEIAGGLASIGFDVGDRAAIMSDTCPAWWRCDLGVMTAGGAVCTIYHSLLPHEAQYIIDHSESKIVFVEDRDQLEKILKVRGELPGLQKIILMNGEGGEDDKDIIDLEALIEAGRKFNKENPKEITARLDAVKPDDLATIIYTSGTTGPPKGVMLSHRAIIFTCWSMSQLIENIEDGDTHLAHLPMAHAYERIGGHFAVFFAGGIIAYARGLETLLEDIEVTQPRILASVPRLFEKIYAVVLERIESGPAWKKKLFAAALETGNRVGELRRTDQPVPLGLALKNAIYYQLVFKKITAKFGRNLEYLISASAPISKEILKFFSALGMVPLEGWGMTECAAPGTFNRLGKVKLGTVGPPIPGAEVRIADDGEVVYRGPNMLSGYYKDDGNTAATVKDGWLYTGDIGTLDEDGYLTITDRKKDMIITAGGKNIAPQNIENYFKLNPFISEIMVYGDRRKFLAALITLAEDKLIEWALDAGIEFKDFADLTTKPEVAAHVEKIIAERNDAFARYEQIKKFAILPKQFTQEEEELTPTLKLKKKEVLKRYGRLLEALYEGLGDGKI